MAKEEGRKVVATNRKARHEYQILDTMEAGMVLRGPEVKSLRDGKVSFQDSFARVDGGEVWLYSLYIAPYEAATRENPDPTRTRKLLLRKAEIRKLLGGVEEKGLTLIPLEIYFRRGFARVSLALAQGRKLHDRRDKLQEQAAIREARQAVGRQR